MKRVSFSLILVVWLICTTVNAAIINVNSFQQSPGGAGDCTLGEAIEAANTDTAVDGCNAGAGADTIVLPPGTYTLVDVDNTAGNHGNNGLPDIISDITITGDSPTNTVITRNSQTPFRFFHISSTGSLTLQSLQLNNGLASANFTGGAILNYGTLNLQNVIIDSNSASSGGAIANFSGNVFIENTNITHNTASVDSGGGIHNVGGRITATDVLFAFNSASNANSASAKGGAIYNSSRAEVSMARATITSNTAAQGGGGIYNTFSSIFSIEDSTIQGNSTDDAGGGAYNEESSTLNIYRSVFNENTSGAGGGGLINMEGSTVNIVNSTFSANTATTSGGGIANAGILSLLNVTVADNSASNGSGGGVAMSGTTEVRNSIISGNTAGSAGPDCFGMAAVFEYSLIGNDASCTLPAGNGNLINVDPRLGPLQDNGGLTLTHALQPGSPAIDAANNQTAPSTDQRGVTRPIDGDLDGTAVADMGAYEYESPGEIGVPAVNQKGLILMFVLLMGISIYFAKRYRLD